VPGHEKLWIFVSQQPTENINIIFNSVVNKILLYPFKIRRKRMAEMFHILRERERVNTVHIHTKKQFEIFDESIKRKHSTNPFCAAHFINYVYSHRILCGWQ
jgi:hypothetical protein